VLGAKSSHLPMDFSLLLIKLDPTAILVQKIQKIPPESSDFHLGLNRCLNVHLARRKPACIPLFRLESKTINVLSLHPQTRNVESMYYKNIEKERSTKQNKGK
jgi:hypothetical protein